MTNKTIPYLSTEDCSSCDKHFITDKMLSRCPYCGHRVISCNACVSQSCSNCDNGSEFRIDDNIKYYKIIWKVDVPEDAEYYKWAYTALPEKDIRNKLNAFISILRIIQIQVKFYMRTSTNTPVG